MVIRTAVLLLLAALLTACDALTPEAITLTPTREFSAPTLAASPTADIHPPTLFPQGVPDRGQSNPQAAALPAQAALPPMIVAQGDAALGMNIIRVTLPGGTLLEGDLYENPPLQTENGIVEPRLPGILLVGAARNAWGSFPAQLRGEGYTVLVIDFGAAPMIQDFASVVQAFSETATVNPGLIGVIGASQGADLALLGCAIEPLCDVVVLLSPVSEATLVNVLPDYGTRPLFIAASSQDTTSNATALTLQSAARGEVQLQVYEGNSHGIDLLTSQPDLAMLIVEWIRQNLPE